MRQVAAALRSASRESDEVYRYGGDEFALLLPSTSARDALGVARRIRVRVGQATRQPGDVASGTHCSIGIACYPADGSDRASLLHAADRALYKAKHDGGDRIRVAA